MPEQSAIAKATCTIEASVQWKFLKASQNQYEICPPPPDCQQSFSTALGSPNKQHLVISSIKPSRPVTDYMFPLGFVHSIDLREVTFHFHISKCRPLSTLSKRQHKTAACEFEILTISRILELLAESLAFRSVIFFFTTICSTSQKCIIPTHPV
jgi:hypothetical protein